VLAGIAPEAAVNRSRAIPGNMPTRVRGKRQHASVDAAPELFDEEVDGE